MPQNKQRDLHMSERRSAARFVNETGRHALGTDLANGRWKHFSHTSKWKTQQPMGERQVLPVLHNLAEALHV